VKKILLVDTNRAAYPIDKSLVTSGHEVWVVGRKSEEPLAKISPNYVQLNYSDMSKVAACVEEKSFDFTVARSMEVSHKTCAELGSGKFPSMDSVETDCATNHMSEPYKISEEISLPVSKLLAVNDTLKHHSA
jgi:hypothetical protein